MTKEELEKEAEEYARDTYEMCSYSSLPYASDRRARQQAFLAGAEPREKRIAELEKENKDIQQSCENYYNEMRSYKNKIAELEDKLANADYQLEGRDNEIRKFEKENKVLTQNLEDTEIINKALEKENAELKDDNKVMADNYSKMEQKFFDNLTKAKELLKRYVPYRQITDSKAYKDLAEETEQFLNSEVEK